MKQVYVCLIYYQTTNFRLSKLKEFADTNFKFDENGRKLSKQVENTVGKGETARYEQFLLFPQCFQKVCFPGASKGVVVWEWLNAFSYLRLYVNGICLCSFLCTNNLISVVFMPIGEF